MSFGFNGDGGDERGGSDSADPENWSNKKLMDAWGDIDGYGFGSSSEYDSATEKKIEREVKRRGLDDDSDGGSSGFSF